MISARMGWLCALVLLMSPLAQGETKKKKTQLPPPGMQLSLVTSGPSSRPEPNAARAGAYRRRASIRPHVFLRDRVGRTVSFGSLEAIDEAWLEQHNVRTIVFCGSSLEDLAAAAERTPPGVRLVDLGAAIGQLLGKGERVEMKEIQSFGTHSGWVDHPEEIALVLDFLFDSLDWDSGILMVCKFGWSRSVAAALMLAPRFQKRKVIKQVLLSGDLDSLLPSEEEYYTLVSPAFRQTVLASWVKRWRRVNRTHGVCPQAALHSGGA